MFGFRKHHRRRVEIRRNRPDVGLLWQGLREPQFLLVIAIAIVFWMVAFSITTLRDQVVAYRPGQYVHRDALSRVKFESRDPEREQQIRQYARDVAPRVYRRIDLAFSRLEHRLLALPSEVSTLQPEQLPRELRLDGGTITALKSIHQDRAEDYKKWVKGYLDLLREAADKGRLVVLPYEQREEDLQMPERTMVKVQLPGVGAGLSAVEILRTYAHKHNEVFPDAQRADLLNFTAPFAEQSFPQTLAASIAGFTVDTLTPTHDLDKDLTEAERNDAARSAPVSSARRHILEKTVLVPRQTTVTPAAWRLLVDEQRAYIAQMPLAQWALRHLGMGALLAVIIAAMGFYIAYYQPRILRNHARAVGIATLFASMLLVAQLAAVGTVPLMVFGIAPTILVAMILAIAYDQRFAIGMASLHGLIVTAAIGQGIDFFAIVWVGALACCLLLDEVRTRGKLVEVGGASAVAMMVVAAALGLIAGDPLPALSAGGVDLGPTGRSCLYVGAAGLGVGFVVLGILPFIEKAFRITTSMSLLELADAAQPLLRRLAMEAPGTYSHSLSVATLAEAAADAIGAESLLCRVGSYYHDIGKMNKADYFCENQLDGRNRHLNLSPSVSLLVIIGHVKDGVELAREYNLPTVLIPFIQQHHGTTLVEYFYHQACNQRKPGDSDASTVSELQYRYPGPRPHSREVAIVMVADAVEGATRAIVEPTASRVETLVHEIIMRRLVDGQFDDCDLTFSELQQVEKAIVKTLLGVYHGRLAYPSTQAMTHGTTAVQSA